MFKMETISYRKAEHLFKRRRCPGFARPFSMKNIHYQFDYPPECPVFEPTREEFKDFLGYISKIRAIGEAAGICKIKPPPDWQPPFAVNVDKFKFVPRIQRLNELEASTRIKLNFLDQIAKFWKLQGIQLKIPTIDKKTLDLYLLYETVHKYGGMPTVNKERKWPQIAIEMGFDSSKNVGFIFKAHYERILHPYDVFQNTKYSKLKTEDIEECEGNRVKKEDGNNISDLKVEGGIKRSVEVVDLLIDEQPFEKAVKVELDEKNVLEMEGKDYTPHRILSRQAIEPPSGKYSRRSAKCFSTNVIRSEMEEEKLSDDLFKRNKELQRLAFFGAGPKLPGYDPNMTFKEDNNKTRGKRANYVYDPLAKYTCKTCHKGDREDQILLCDGCDDGYHTKCLVPPLQQVPEGDWRCPYCVAVEVQKPIAAFGFEQAQREYTLQQFGEMADQFKERYFEQEVHKVPYSLVEKEFWRIVGSIEEDVTVEYGADLHTMDHGSGFPTTISDDEMMTCEAEYADSPWNLNNLPILEGSVLQHIDSDISGMKVPWMYVGMCFATFCWHNEDHWNYSINYLHWGEPKTWYGVPGDKAELFEETMKKAAPELFQTQPDLLHQLVTIMNPNILMAAKVPVCRTDQQAGEFVVTFPRAYHAGFNQGYNFAEAVNFAPADWLKMGRECVAHYSTLCRYCVFSHDELVCKMAEQCDKLNTLVAAATYEDMLAMVKTEKKLRKALLEWGVTSAVQTDFGKITDDERLCEICKTTCYLSCVSCKCPASATKNACLKHYTQLCECPPNQHVLKYKHSLDALLIVLQKLKSRAEEG